MSIAQNYDALSQQYRDQENMILQNNYQFPPDMDDRKRENKSISKNEVGDNTKKHSRSNSISNHSHVSDTLNGQMAH